ncbi:endonuclease domain-containing protein [Vibrio sp. JC009]|uniref:endonuclease domain-containing protein n=1 Tax=Vibrio sp. JC009 TaxID=2912314 RepID=UPI0023B1C011|nr:endonuclease domain-containing protein [Vibrio sp. JC009]WED20593.1 endonuclease domain-containing protein [Vibrio sp. JC009]
MSKAARVFNAPFNTKFRKKLRLNMPEPERRLWNHIRKQQIGAKFRRQHGIGPYIVDFYCPTYKLVVEIDGDSHYLGTEQQRDRIRDQYLKQIGLKVLRFTNADITDELTSVLEKIKQNIY